MSKIPPFAAYAAAFETSCASDDGSLVEPFFAEDAVCAIDVGPSLGGVPDFTLELEEETVRFDGDRIARLEDHDQPARAEHIASWLRAHGGKLGSRAE